MRDQLVVAALSAILAAVGGYCGARLSFKQSREAAKADRLLAAYDRWASALNAENIATFHLALLRQKGILTQGWADEDVLSSRSLQDAKQGLFLLEIDSSERERVDLLTKQVFDLRVTGNIDQIQSNSERIQKELEAFLEKLNSTGKFAR